MAGQGNARAEDFLKQYRRLEGLLEKRYVGHRMSSGSVVMEYLRDPDSEPCRTELDLCREIRNLLSHNSDGAGEAVVQPSEAVLRMLYDILEHVQRPRMAVDYGTPMKEILFAHPNDPAVNIMRHMLRMGYSHVPVRDRTGLIGVFSAGSLFAYLGERGFGNIPEDLRIGDMREKINFGDARSEKYMFLPEDATLLTVRDAFEKREERNSRLAVVFITRDGTRESELLAMLTPWDVLRESLSHNQEELENGEKQT